MGGTHHVKVPNQRPLKTGTLLGGVLKPVATHHKLTVEELLATGALVPWQTPKMLKCVTRPH
jgi:hypothetical protein